MGEKPVVGEEAPDEEPGPIEEAPIEETPAEQEKTSSYREENVVIYVDGKEVADGGASYIEFGITYAPFDELAYYLGAGFTSWNKGEESAVMRADGLEIELDAAWDYIVANGRYLYSPGAYREENGVLMVPVRRICEAFGAEINWNDELCAVDIKTTGKPIMSGDEFYDEDDLYWMSRIINAESRGEILKGKIAVGNVVLNRMRSDSFPDTIKGVIFDTVGGVQFSPAYSGAIYMRPSTECVVAAKMVLEGAVVTEDALYFIPNRFAETCWASRNRPYDMCIDGHTFFA